MTRRQYNIVALNSKYGTIVSVNSSNDTCYVLVDGVTYSDVPIHYHCDDTETDEGGSSAFQAGDEVVCLFEYTSIREVCGFKDGRKPCSSPEYWWTNGWTYLGYQLQHYKNGTTTDFINYSSFEGWGDNYFPLEPEYDDDWAEYVDAISTFPTTPPTGIYDGFYQHNPLDLRVYVFENMNEYFDVDSTRFYFDKSHPETIYQVSALTSPSQYNSWVHSGAYFCIVRYDIGWAYDVNTEQEELSLTIKQMDYYCEKYYGLGLEFSFDNYIMSTFVQAPLTYQSMGYARNWVYNPILGYWEYIDTNYYGYAFTNTDDDYSEDYWYRWRHYDGNLVVSRTKEFDRVQSATAYRGRLFADDLNDYPLQTVLSLKDQWDFTDTFDSPKYDITHNFNNAISFVYKGSFTTPSQVSTMYTSSMLCNSMRFGYKDAYGLCVDSYSLGAFSTSSGGDSAYKVYNPDDISSRYARELEATIVTSFSKNTPMYLDSFGCEENGDPLTAPDYHRTQGFCTYGLADDLRGTVSSTMYSLPEVTIQVDGTNYVYSQDDLCYYPNGEWESFTSGAYCYQMMDVVLVKIGTIVVFGYRQNYFYKDTSGVLQWAVPTTYGSKYTYTTPMRYWLYDEGNTNPVVVEDYIIAPLDMNPSTNEFIIKSGYFHMVEADGYSGIQFANIFHATALDSATMNDSYHNGDPTDWDNGGMPEMQFAISYKE